jgi:hypothetical protein
VIIPVAVSAAILLEAIFAAIIKDKESYFSTFHNLLWTIGWTAVRTSGLSWARAAVQCLEVQNGSGDIGEEVPHEVSSTQPCSVSLQPAQSRSHADMTKFSNWTDKKSSRTDDYDLPPYTVV